MSKSKITPVILAGGAGTRLWPVSREDVPKQFCTMVDGTSLLQQTVKRTQNTDQFEAPVIVTGKRHRELVKRQLDELGCVPKAIICEPVAKDTAAAILLASELFSRSGNSSFLVMPSDHLISDNNAFLRAVRSAEISSRKDGFVVTFGIKPTHPETGFGYIRAGFARENRSVYSLETFIEKPEVATAEKLIRDPQVYWNAGIFMFDGKVLRKEFDKHAPRIASCVAKSTATGHWNGVFFYPEPISFSRSPAISFDYALMEKTDRAVVAPIDPKWSDLGSWKSIWETSERDENENVIGENCHTVNSRDCLVRSDGPVVGIAGVEDVVVVASRDAVLVTSRSNPQDVKGLVEKLKDQDIPAATRHPGEDRPWGRFDSLDRGGTHQVKRIRVDPSQQLSLQYHHYRAEHWVIVTGTATVTVDEKVSELNVGEQVFIPQGATHRLENFTQSDVEIIEVQIGNYLGEDDIVRVEDIYGRNQTDDLAKNHAA